jgi:AraC family transcriptional regulator of adaptative response/methylated-DNA-[protein]-cysteine methyltransferase
MMTEAEKRAYYEATSEEKLTFTNIAYMGVTSTGVFCQAKCPARRPKFENCRFFKTAEQAVAAGFRPCKRCWPMGRG